MEKLIDVALLILADLNVAGEAGRIKTRILTLVSGTGANLDEVLDSLVKREYMTIVKVAGARAIGNKHFITELGQRAFVEATTKL